MYEPCLVCGNPRRGAVIGPAWVDYRVPVAAICRRRRGSGSRHHRVLPRVGWTAIL